MEGDITHKTDLNDDYMLEMQEEGVMLINSIEQSKYIEDKLQQILSSTQTVVIHHKRLASLFQDKHYNDHKIFYTHSLYSNQPLSKLEHSLQPFLLNRQQLLSEIKAQFLIF